MGTLKSKIVILHGWTYTLEKWNDFGKLLNINGYEVEFLKIPGLSEKSDEVWDLEKYANWLDLKIGKNKVTLMGHSNGGRIALFYASLHPEKITRLIVVDSAGIYHRNFTLQLKRFIFGTVAKVGKLVTESPGIKKFLYSLAREKDYNVATPNMKKSMINLITSDLKNILPKINVNTLIIWGSEDQITPLSDAYLMKNLIKNSQLVIIKGARHSPFFTHPEKVQAAINKLNDI